MICYNCGNEISTEGANCPFCGAPLNTASGQPNPGPYQQAGPQQGQPVQPGPQPNFQQGQPGQPGPQTNFQQGQPGQGGFGGQPGQPGFGGQGGYGGQPGFGGQPGQPGQSGGSMDPKTASIIVYITWIGLLIAILSADKNEPFFKHHLNNALVILIASTVVGLIGAPLCFIPIIGGLVVFAAEIFLFVCMIMGIVNAVNGECKPLPIIGDIHLIK